MIIYKVENQLNGKIYIGQTTQKPSDRWRGHMKSDKKSAISLAIRKYGKENFVFEVLYEASSLEELNKKEIEYINSLNTLSPNGYNLKDGGCNGKWSENSKKAMSEKRKGSGNPMFGLRFKQTQEFCDKVSKAKKGIKNPKLSENLKNNEKFKASMRLVPKNRRSYSGGGNPNSKEVRFNGIVYSTMKEASKTTGISLYRIRNHFLKKES